MQLKPSSSWHACRLGDVLTLQRGNDLPVSERRNGDYPVIGANGIVGTHDTAISQGPGVTVGRSGSVGEVTWVQSPFWPLNTALWVKDFHGNDPLFVYYLLCSLPLKDYAAGVSVPTLNRNLLHPLPVLLPPLDEQQRIAHILSTIQHFKETNEAVVRAVESVFSSTLAVLMEPPA